MALTSRQIYLNVHVKDLKQSMAFFTELGFEFNLQFTDDKAACLVINENTFVMLLVEEYFKSFSKKEIVDTASAAQILIAIGADSREQVDELVNKAVAAGGTLYSEAVDHGFMYQWGFQDVNGHIWEVAYMDMSAFAEQTEG